MLVSNQEPNAQTPTHAEGQVFDQALLAKDKGGVARLFVDATLCSLCGKSRGVERMIKPMDYEKPELYVMQPDGSITADVLQPKLN